MAVAEPENTSRRRAPRADALRNRDAIIEAASAVLADQGTAVDVREIARRSGVGMGTLYRHFPTKEDLVRTVLRGDFTRWAESARAAAADAEDPWAALVDFYEQALTGYAQHRAIMEHFALALPVPDPEGIGKLRLVVVELCDRARSVLRPGVTVDDLLLLLVSLGHAVQVTDECRPHMWHRLLRISLDGLRADNLEPLPAAASLVAGTTAVTASRAAAD
ncbi:TetR/AcrR family transcriptional regulator [Nocardia vermiculata]|uniref:TetR/AcrR family transcriptional regulator n=1 Tax=Nocardia vermiculata TaxID=257274 RepID=A0A846Y8K0_9NOCA|nr:TetR/AcrR family transcriptional regulator [Nocardia vermiculata]NKY53059.1 TetR/AcrR family transcriptional regulator [Nocardia vermiculata]